MAALVGDLLEGVEEEVCGDNPSRENLSFLWKDEEIYGSHQGVAAAYILLFLIGVPLNIYILAVVIYKKLYRQPTFLLLCNLAITDLHLCLGPLLFNTITVLNKQGSFGSNDFVRCHICKVGATFVIFSSSTSFTLMLLSIDRLIFFKTPLKYEKFVTVRRVFMACVVEWVTSLAISLPTLGGYGDFIYSLVCGPVFLTAFHIQRGIVYVIVSTPISIGATTILVVCNAWMVILAVKVYRKVKKIGTMSVTPASDSKEKDESSGGFRRTASTRRKWKSRWGMEVARKQCAFLRTFGAIIVVDFVSLIPIFVLGALYIFTGEVPVGLVIFVIVAIYSQTISHPILQVLFAPELRKLMFQCKWLKSSKLGKCTVFNCCVGDFLMRDVAGKLSKVQAAISSRGVVSESSVSYQVELSSRYLAS